MHMLNGCKVSPFQKLLIQQLSYTAQQISKVEANIQKYIMLFERDKVSSYPEKQKDLLHSIINRITIKFSNNIKERCIENIELFFDTSLPINFMPICGMAPPD
ncbi:hypothetical protein ABD71_23290 [Brevibacillus laterosporus]|nr:hypothetical protein [Brevibacillus laterosporus]